MSLKSKNITRNKRADKEISVEDKIQEIKIEVKEAEEDWELDSEEILIEDKDISIKIEMGKTLIIKEDQILKDLDTQKVILMIKITLKKLIVTLKTIKVRREIEEEEIEA